MVVSKTNAAHDVVSEPDCAALWQDNAPADVHAVAEIEWQRSERDLPSVAQICVEMVFIRVLHESTNR